MGSIRVCDGRTLNGALLQNDKGTKENLLNYSRSMTIYGPGITINGGTKTLDFFPLTERWLLLPLTYGLVKKYLILTRDYPILDIPQYGLVKNILY